jgi:hypothetical protein
MAKNQVVVYHKKAVATHGMTRVFTDGDEPVTGHGKDYQAHAAEYATTHAANVDHVVGLDAKAVAKVADAKKVAAKAKAGAKPPVDVPPARLKDAPKE